MQQRSARSATGSPLRFWMGMAQMFVAGTALVLLVETGLSAASIVSATAATGLTVTSRWLFRRRQ
jgi:hypothetical protein